VTTTYVGPFDREVWPEKLVARAVEPGGFRRAHGYEIAELAHAHSIADVAWLMLSGELPSAATRAALDTALVLLAPVHVGEAPSHAALLSRIAGAPPTTTMSIAAVGLGELVRHELDVLEPWLRWLASPSPGPVPAVAIDPGPTIVGIAFQHWLSARFVAWFGPERGLPDVPLHRVACAYAILHRLELRSPLAIETLAMWARLPAIAAEAANARAGAVRQYPARLPDFQYVDDRGTTP
jgi:hypothetical protein